MRIPASNKINYAIYIHNIIVYLSIEYQQMQINKPSKVRTNY